MDQHGSSEEQVADKLLRALEDGAALKDIQGISEDMMEGLYAYAYDFYNQGRLDEAETFFRFLCLYDFYNPDYFIGLAAVHQLRKKYQKACDFYAVAFAMAGDNYKPVFFSGQCQLSMGNIAAAKQCFKHVCERSSDESIIKKAKVYLDTIERNKSQDKAPQEES